MNEEKCSLTFLLPLGCFSVSSSDKPKKTVQSHQNAHRIKDESRTSAAPPLEEEEEAFYHAGTYDIPLWHRNVLSLKPHTARLVRD